jgi:simple sugar transport system permease protein
MAAEVVALGRGGEGKIRSFRVGLFLSVITLGIYGPCWYYFLNDELRNVGRKYEDPGLSESKPAESVAALVLGGWLVVPGLLTLYNFGRRIQRAEGLAGIDPADQINPTTAFLLQFPFGLLIIPSLIHYWYVTEHHNAALLAASGNLAAGTARSRRASVVSPWDIVRRLLITREGSIIVVTAVLILYFSLTVSQFPTTTNFQQLLTYFTWLAILAAGEVFLMINGEIDLSIGGVYLFAPLIFYEIVGGGIPLLPSLILTMVVCMGVGLVNGVITAIFNINSFITTLGTLFTLQGLTLIISHAEQLNMPGAPTTNPSTGATVEGTFANVFGAGTYSELVWALIVIVVMQAALTRTRWGLHTIAVGSNRIAAAEAGIRVRFVLIRNFVVCSLFAGFVGILEAVRSSSITPDPSASNSILLDGIAAAVIGGTLLAGGSGTVVGALIGALFLGVLQDGLAIKGVNANYLDFYLGLAILLAMGINVYVGRARRRSGLG